MAAAMGQTRVLQSNATILSDVMSDDLDLGVISVTNQMFQITILHFKKVDDLSRPACSIVACVHAALSCFQGALRSAANMLAVPKAYAHGNRWFDVSSVIENHLHTSISYTFLRLSVETQRARQATCSMTAVMLLLPGACVACADSCVVQSIA